MAGGGPGEIGGRYAGADHEPLSAAGWVQQTPPGYAIIDLYEDGAVENRYMPLTY